jgi:ankyrin repeat protein
VIGSHFQMTPSLSRPRLRSRPGAKIFDVRILLCLFACILFCVAAEVNAQTSRITDRSQVPPIEDSALAKAKMAVRVKDFKKAVAIWREAAERGSARAEYRLGVAYRSGRGVDQDSSKAAFWFAKGALSGDRNAQYALGKLYQRGHGVTRDRDRALELIGVAARNGHPEAKSTLKRITRSSSIAYATAGGRVAASQNDPRAALNQAIRAGDVGSAREALARGAPIDGAPGDNRHWRPLILAIDREQLILVQLLIEHHANPNQKSRLGEPALILAIRKGNVEIVRRLLSAGSKPTGRSKSGYTPLMEAARLGRVRMVDVLLAAGANPKATLDDESSAADIARRFRFEQLAVRLRRAGATTRDDRVATNRFAVLESSKRGVGNEAISALPLLIEASRRGDAKLVNEIIASGSTLDVLDPEGDTALHRAAEGGHAETIELLLAAGLQADLRGRDETTALMRAMASKADGSEKVVDVLLAAGADPNRRDGFAAGLIDYAAKGATAEKVALLLSAGASWSANDAGSSLVRAAVAGRLTAFEALLSVATRPSDRISALCGAIGADQPRIRDRLLREKVELDLDCGDGRSALLMAAQSGREESLSKLLDNGADPNQIVANGDTALIAAASRGHLKILNALLHGGAQVDLRGARRMTALMGAAANGQLEIVHRLLEAGADRRMRAESDRTAYDLAKSAGHEKIATAIESYQSGWSRWLGSN